MTNKRNQSPQDRVNAFLDADGKVRSMPKRKTDRVLVLAHLAEYFELDHSYSEPEVNAILKAANTFGDHVLLRRELFDHGFLVRNPDGSDYQRPSTARESRNVAFRPLQRNPITPPPNWS